MKEYSTESRKTIGCHPEDMTAWSKMQARLMENAKDAKQIVTEKSGHDIQNTEPELIIEATRELIEIIRNK